ncbi:MAG: hypothetical protein U1A78_26670 [Polyangia bacterium]
MNGLRRKVRAKKEEIRASICARQLETGDVVLVPDAKWETYVHPEAGAGKWASFVEYDGKIARVRPFSRLGVTQRKAEDAPTVVHIDDVLTDKALAFYRKHRDKFPSDAD